MIKSWAADSCSGFFVRCIYLYTFLFLLYFTFYRLFKRKLRFTLHSSLFTKVMYCYEYQLVKCVKS